MGVRNIYNLSYVEKILVRYKVNKSIDYANFSIPNEPR